MPLSLVSLLVHAYAALRLIPSLDPFVGVQVAVAGLIAASAICLQMGLNQWRRRRRTQSGRDDAVMLAAFVAMGFVSSLVVLTFLRDVMLLGVWAAVWLGAAIPITVVAQWSAFAVAVAATLMTLIGLFNARRTARVVTVDIPITNLPTPLHGFTMNNRNRNNRARISALALAMAVTTAAVIGLTSASGYTTPARRTDAALSEPSSVRGFTAVVPGADDAELNRLDRGNEHHG